jgi:copper chaperone CopZ
MRQLFAGVTFLALVGAVYATDGEVQCKAEGLHICCKQCENSVKGILAKVDGVSKVAVDRKGKTVTFEAKDAKAADAAVTALFNGGFCGKMMVGDKTVDVKNTDLGAKADELTFKNVHACCPQCISALEGLFPDATVTITGKGAQRTVAIKGKELDPNAVLQTMQKAGFHGSYDKK